MTPDKLPPDLEAKCEELASKYVTGGLEKISGPLRTQYFKKGFRAAVAVMQERELSDTILLGKANIKINSLLKEITNLRSQLAAATEALEFYQQSGEHFGSNDGGAIARAALEKLASPAWTDQKESK